MDDYKLVLLTLDDIKSINELCTIKKFDAKFELSDLAIATGAAKDSDNNLPFVTGAIYCDPLYLEKLIKVVTVM